MSPREYLTEIWRKRYFWWSLVRMDVHRKYQRSYLGLVWSLLHPLGIVAVICLVMGSLLGYGLKEFAPHVLSGIAIWWFFSGIVQEGARSFIISEHYIRQQPAPLAIYPLRTTLSAMVHLLIVLTAFVILAAILRGPSSIVYAVLALPAVFLLFLLGWGVACCVSSLTVVFRDVEHICQVALQALFYMTPVFWMDAEAKLVGIDWLSRFNPLAALMRMVREPVMHGRFAATQDVALSLIATVVVGLVAVYCLGRMQKRLIFYL